MGVFNLSNLSFMYDQISYSTVDVRGMDIVIILLSIIALCELIRLIVFLYHEVLRIYGVNK